MRTLLVFTLLFLLNGCGIVDYYFLTPPEDTAQELFENAKNEMQDKNYPSAIESLSKLNDRYPFSPYALTARLMLGDAYFLNKQYLEAIDVYEEFLNMHPRNEKVDYVLFQIGVSKFNTHHSIDLPQTQLASAIESFQRIINSYPQSQYAEQAHEYITKCRKLLAEHEIYVAEYYFKAQLYKAAWMRFSYIVDTYSDLQEIHDLADSRRKVAFYYYQQQENTERRSPSMFKSLFDWL
ncbi:MAG: outer membrane protein assembly factor BamD [Desulfovibrionales bacterium]|nr:outer membrane protein assembly factor BamD [Desulfovibrionales bacterium]